MSIKLTVDWQGEHHVIEASTPDQIRYEKVARVQKWPMPGATDMWPVTYMAFLAWSALKRQNLIDQAVTWDEFSEAAEVDGDETATVEANPTRPEPPSGSG